MFFAVGARFACVKCSLRGVRATCPRCQGPTVDLSKQTLEGEWPLWAAHRDGKRLFHPVVARRSKWLKRLAIALTVLNVVPAFALSFINDSGHAPVSALVAGTVIGVLVFTPLVFVFYWAFLFAVALAFHAMGAVFGAMAELTPIGELRLRVVALISNVISRPLLGLLRLQLADAKSEGTPLRGVLAQPLTVELVTDRLGVMERYDAVLAGPLVVKLDGEATDQTLDFESGVLKFTQAGAAGGKGELPPWLLPTREGSARRAQFQPGTRIVFRRESERVAQLELL